MKLNIMQYYLLPPVTTSILGPNVLLSTLISDALNLCSSLKPIQKCESVSIHRSTLVHLRSSIKSVYNGE
jgi:hypothetical protein